MFKSSFRIVFTVLVLPLLVFGCSDENLTDPIVEDDEPIVPSSTIPVSKEEAETSILSISDEGVIEVSQSSSLADELDVDDIIVTESSDAAQMV